MSDATLDMPKASVVVVDDDSDFVEGMLRVCHSLGLEVFGYTSGQAFLAKYDPSQPACLILDYQMPGMDGLEVARYLLNSPIAPPIILLTGHGTIPVAVESMRSGIIEFIEKPFEHDVLIRAVRAGVAEASRRHSEWVVRESALMELGKLTAREREIFDYVVKGAMSKSVAAKLDLSVKTVEMHRSHIMQKLGASTLSELIELNEAARGLENKT